jgi:hypothetical protein
MVGSSSQIFEQSIQIDASATVVEKCITDISLMHLWLNPILRCEPIGEWNTEVGSRSRFLIKIPLLKPTLESVVVARKPGSIVWQFKGFFKGRDRWECLPSERGTLLINKFEFEIPNPIVSWGFRNFAMNWTKSDMRAQLKRLKRVAENLHQASGEG